MQLHGFPFWINVKSRGTLCHIGKFVTVTAVAAGNGGSPSPRAPRQAPAKVRIPRPPPAPASPRDGPSQPPPELGEYASGRPRRHTKTPGYRLGSSVEDEHQMVEPEHYRGIPGSGAPEAQPFRIEVTPTAQVTVLLLHTLIVLLTVVRF